MFIKRAESYWIVFVLFVIGLPSESFLMSTNSQFSYSKNDVKIIEDSPSSVAKSRSIRALPPPKNQPNVNGEPCYGYNNQKGRCLPLENCVLQPLKENYIKYKSYYCITSQNTVGVCCPNTIAIPDVYNESTFNSPRSDSPSRRRSSRSIPNGLQFTPSDSENKPLSRLQRRSVADEANTCGRNGRLISQVSKDGLVQNKAWPWAVTVINADTKEHHCGATLISRYHILSAAHCFYYGSAFVFKEAVKARLGEYDFKKQNESKYNDYDIAEIIVHEHYDEPTHENDIALLVLAKPARYTIYAQPACMPTKGEDYEGKTAVVVGWGTIEFSGPRSSVLREVQIPVWKHSVCSTNYLQTIFENNVCAAGYKGDEDACQGDSGGPLMMSRQDGRWEVIGVVSWGDQCGMMDKPGVYTQVNKFYDWLQSKGI